MKAWLVVIAALVACKDKDKPAKQKEPTPVVDTKGGAQRVARLPELADSGAQVMLSTTAGLVAIHADGTIHVAKPPQTDAIAGDPFAGAKAVPLADVTKTLGLPVVAPRTPNAIAVEGPSESQNPIDVQFGRLGHPEPASGAPVTPKRATSAFALSHAHDVSAGVVVFADAQAPANVLVDVLAQTGGFVAARKGTQLVALPLAFDRQAPAPVPPDRTWVEARLGKDILVETVPSPAKPIAKLDDLAAAVTGAPAVDLLVAPDSKVQDVVASVVQLRAAKIEAVGFGRVPADAAGRGLEGPRVIAWDFYLAEGNKTDPAPFRAAFDKALEPMRTCFAKDPKVGGTARIEVHVQPSGKVATADAPGLPPPVMKCAVSALQTTKFPASAPGVKLGANVAFVAK